MTLYAEPVSLPDLFEEVGLDLDPAVGFDEWARLGQNLQRVAKSHQWWVGDWLAFGEDRFGESAAQALDMTLDLKTLSNYRWVAGRIPKVERRPGLSWTHHRIAAELDSALDRRQVLDEAEARNLTSRELQDLVDARKPAKERPEVEPKDKTTVTFTLSFTLERSKEKHGRIIADKLGALLEAELAERGIDPTKTSRSPS